MLEKNLMIQIPLLRLNPAQEVCYKFPIRCTTDIQLKTRLPKNMNGHLLQRRRTLSSFLLDYVNHSRHIAQQNLQMTTSDQNVENKAFPPHRAFSSWKKILNHQVSSDAAQICFPTEQLNSRYPILG